MSLAALRHQSWTWTVKAMTPLLRPLERRISTQALALGRDPGGPVFIVGVPRCGSTLLYKVMVDALGLAYIDGLTARLSATPLVGTRLSQRLGLAPTEGFENSYGTMPGLGSPHEAGQFWYRWFPRAPAVHAPAGSIPEESRRQIRATISAIAALHDRPVLFKNLFNSLRIGALIECLPEASFVICRRDPLANALSLLRGRAEQGSDKSAWWSLPPRELRALQRRPYAEQVAGQVLCVERQIAADVASFGQERFVTVTYEGLCADVHGTVAGIASFLQSRGCRVVPDLQSVPETFEVRRVTGLDPNDERAVAHALESLDLTKLDLEPPSESDPAQRLGHG